MSGATSRRELPLVEVTRYVTPLREGGSLPGLVEAADEGFYVCKFSGAGQGPKVLVAEVIAAGLARALGLKTPDLVRLSLSPDIARFEADEEVQDLLTASLGVNLGVDFLPGSFGFDAAFQPDPQVAARVLWLDGLIANVDRSWRNPNMLLWGGDLWVIDHGASLYVHHGWANPDTVSDRFAGLPFGYDDHALREYLPQMIAADAELAGLITAEVVADVVAAVPQEWLGEQAERWRSVYAEQLLARLNRRGWVPAGAPQ